MKVRRLPHTIRALISLNSSEKDPCNLISRCRCCKVKAVWQGCSARCQPWGRVSTAFPPRSVVLDKLPSFCIREQLCAVDKDGFSGSG
ncbi:hypothetical protein CDAR_90511 [Caerostris darwini]|uniref:Uncharacterized protein n=1 Tax=Caerostris darwini TaxID=1538125 RepID=A0AAV4V3S3_9ARAC|nr:hypothetical protein CDAR_90511 [Caerostris darwini]